jgi:ABC-type nitrate/sulfonate/bicarbonate transport system substrate-binding protein
MDNNTHDLVRAIVFPGVHNLPIYAAETLGFFAKRAIRLELTYTQSSEEQRDGISNGTYDIAHSAIDNAIAMADVAGEDVVSFVGLDRGFNQFMTAPGIATYEDLRGKILGVDAPDTAFALIAYELLNRHGLQRARDYTVKPIGATRFRLEALLAGTCDFAMLNLPFCLFASAAGLGQLEDPQKAIGAYQANAGLAQRHWMERNADLLTRYIASFVEGLRWVMAPVNREAGITLLADGMKIPADIARRCCEIILDPVDGFVTDAKINREGLMKVRELRSNFTGIVNPRSLDSYIKESYYHAALALV